MITWNEAQHICEVDNMTLFQYDSEDKYDEVSDLVDYHIRAFFETTTDIGDVVFLGLRRNKQVHTQFLHFLFP